MSFDVTVETDGDRFHYTDVDEIMIADHSHLVLLSKNKIETTVKVWWFWTKTIVSTQNVLIAAFASGNWLHVYRSQNERASDRATVEKVSR